MQILKMEWILIKNLLTIKKNITDLEGKIRFDNSSKMDIDSD